MKGLVLLALFSVASASFLEKFGLNIFSSKKPHGFGICVNTIGGSYTYNDAATRTACEWHNTKENNKCVDCIIVINESTHCSSEKKQLDKAEFHNLCKDAGADRSLSN
ncbi:hypothetical protein HI914_03308 [Erysiphe necator]|uniref:Secreted protein n=1 Tax=Uncinula necator TaxID=52586 RepID=A0A0B1PHP2_UNCNE|nr:hypothetical protein HI914_03308 [Erysiphe necator]KHJ36296.1 hypothetical protein EV44_g0525 [Erysiphe necator]